MVPLRPIILLIFLKPWHYQQTLFFLPHHMEGLPFPAISGHQWGSETSQVLSLGGCSTCQHLRAAASITASPALRTGLFQAGAWWRHAATPTAQGEGQLSPHAMNRL